jgi:hypothetical protein
MDLFIKGAILIAVVLVLGLIFDWLLDISGWIIFGILAAAVTAWLLAAGVQAIQEADKPDKCWYNYTYVC